MTTKTKSPKQKQFKSAIAALDWLAEHGVDRVIAAPERHTSIRNEVEDLRKYLGGNYDVIVRENDEYDPPKYEVTCKDRGTIDYLETYESAKKRAADREHERAYRESLVAEKNPIIKRKLDEAEAMRTFIFCTSRGLKPEIIEAPDAHGGTMKIGLIGAHRPCGGVVITSSGIVMSAEWWCGAYSSEDNPYVIALVRKVRDAMQRAADNAKELSAIYAQSKNVWFDI
jgi:hypothetical protein